MNFTTFSLILVVILSAIAVSEGLLGSYQVAVVAVAGLGFVLSMRAVGLGKAVRPFATPRGEPAPGAGPVTSLTTAVDGARRGSYFFQAQIASVVRPGLANHPGVVLPKELVDPPREGRRLKGEEYLSELEAAVEVLKDD